MSPFQMQELPGDEEVAQLKKYAANKGIQLSTLENELFKKDIELREVRDRLNETIQKFQCEVDKVLKFEEDVNYLKEDAAAERLARENLETTVRTAKEKLVAEQKNSRSLQLELDSYALRTSSEHDQEMKRVQHEKLVLERQLKALEAQVDASKSSIPPSRLPRPVTVPNATTDAETHSATLESELSSAKREIEELNKNLLMAHQDAAKVSRLQADFIVSENARMRAEKAVKATKQEAKDLRDKLQEQDEELEYWRNSGTNKSLQDDKVEEVEKARDEALQSLELARRKETTLRKRLEDIEDNEIELVTEREEALNELHRLQTEMSSQTREHNTSTHEKLRVDLVEREKALISAREVNAELQRLYQDTAKACDAAKSRIVELERQLHPSDRTPLIVVSPPPSPHASKPYIIEPSSATHISPEHEAIVTRLLSAIDRLRGERDGLRRDLLFAEAEKKATVDALESQHGYLSRIKNATHPTDDAINQFNEELDQMNSKFESLRTEFTCRTDQLASNEGEMEVIRMHAQEFEQKANQCALKVVKYSKLATVALLCLQRLGSTVENEVNARENLLALHQELTNSFQVLTCDREELDTAYQKLKAELQCVLRDKQDLVASERTLRGDLVDKKTRLMDAAQEIQQREMRISNLDSEVQDLQIQVAGLQYELNESREDLIALESRQISEANSNGQIEHGSTKALRVQIDLLEQRVSRRTEQIGILQHDNKRLETNLRVAEETISEMSTEAETLHQQNTCLVEDCAQAREDRDSAKGKIEELEIQLETMGKTQDELIEIEESAQKTTRENDEHVLTIDALIRVIVGSEAKTRTLGQLLKQRTNRLSSLDGKIVQLENQYAAATGDAERLLSELEFTTLTLRDKSEEVEALTVEVTAANDQIQRYVSIVDRYKETAQSQQHNLEEEKLKLITTIGDLEEQLASTESSKATLSQQLEVAKSNETALKVRVEELEQQTSSLLQSSQSLSTELASVNESLGQERAAHAEAIVILQSDFESETASLKEQLETDQQQLLALRAEYTAKVQEFSAKLNENQLEGARKASMSRASMESELRRLQAQHAEEILVLRSQLKEAEAERNGAHGQMNTFTEEFAALQSDYDILIARYGSIQVELSSVEQTLVIARTQIDDQDIKIQSLQHEKKTMEMERSHLDAELDKVSTKYQYVEQQYKRSEHEGRQLKDAIDRLRAENVRLEEFVQSTEINFALKINQLEQKLASTERELEKHRDHRHCNDTVAGLAEKQAILEESLGMANREIEEKDDRILEFLKEEKRLRGKIESLTRKIQNLTSKINNARTSSPSINDAQGPVKSISQPNFNRPFSPPPVPAIPSDIFSIRPPTRIPSSPGNALRSKTPEINRVFSSGLATVSSQTLHLRTPEKPNHAFRMASQQDIPMAVDNGVTTSSSKCKKRRLPEDFTSSDPPAVQAMVEPGVCISTPSKFRKRLSDGKSGFTPTRYGVRPSTSMALQSPARPSVPFREATNSPRPVATSIGLGKPSIAQARAPAKSRSWLNKNRAPSAPAEENAFSLRPS